MKASPWLLFVLAQALCQVSGQTLTLEVVQKTSYPFPIPTNAQDLAIVGTGSDGATTLMDRIRVSEYLVIDDSRSTPLISTDTQTATFTQTFVADGPSAYQIIYSTGAVGLIQSCTFDSEESGHCVEREWVDGQSSTRTTTFTGPIVPYQTVTQLAKSETTGSDSPNTDSSNNTAQSNDMSLWATGVAAVFCFLTLF